MYLHFSFWEKHQFPGVIGLIDGTHVALVPLEAAREHNFINRKGYHSLNVMIVRTYFATNYYNTLYTLFTSSMRHDVLVNVLFMFVCRYVMLMTGSLLSTLLMVDEPMIRGCSLLPVLTTTCACNMMVVVAIVGFWVNRILQFARRTRFK